MKKISSYDIKFLPPKKLSTNRSYSLAVNDYGELFSWGNNKECKLGHEIENKEFLIQIPKKYSFFNNNYLQILEVSCGDSHILALSTEKNEASQKSGEVYAWGLSMHGRLGSAEEHSKGEAEGSMSYMTIPKKINLPDKVVRIACGSDFSACITIRGELYTWGNNKLGYLGVETVKIEDKQNYVTTPTLVKSLMSKVVIQVSCGSKHMMCLTSDKLVYSWGSGNNGVLGHDNNDGLNKPEIIKDLKQHEIIFISAGEFSSAAINSFGHLFLWGRGKYGILGHGSEENISKPKRIQDPVLTNEKIYNVSCGFYHTLCCAVGDKSFAWGYSEDGRLGCIDKNECDNKKRVITPREIFSLRGINISQIYSGYYHSFAISTSGKLWGWGKNCDFILGMINQEDDEKKSNKNGIIYSPQELNANKNLTRISGEIINLQEDFFKKTSPLQMATSISDGTKIKTIACGGSHSLAITTGGIAYAWGYGADGQLGIKDLKCANRPTKIEFGDRYILKIYAGYSHSMAISSKDEIYVWGDGSLGKLARETSCSDIPLAIEELCVKKVKKGACGYDNCAAITADKKLYTWGGNSNNKLGINNCDNNYESTPRQVESLIGVKKVSLGFWHSAALLVNNEVFTWGNGFMGQLGHEDLISKATPEKVDYNNLKFKNVKCGAYHTVGIDIRNQLYIWGKGGHNLNSDPGKHKTFPEIVDELKHIKGGIRKIRAGYGNTIVITSDKHVYGWGDNTDGKVGSDSKNQIIYQVGKINFESALDKKNIPITKIFAGYNHCFALTDTEDIYGWGSSKSFRLTESYGSQQFYIPKILNFFINEKTLKGNQNMVRSSVYIDQKAITEWLANKNSKFNFSYVQRLIENDDPKFLDENLMRRDAEIQKEFSDKIKKINLISFDAEKYIHYDMMLRLRIKNINHKINGNSSINESSIFTHIDEIEKIYTLFYTHPCLFKEYFEKVIDVSNFPSFMTGIKPLFKDLQIYSRKCESMDNIVFLSFFKTMIKNDFLSCGKSIDQLFVKSSYSEQLIENYFYNRYGKNVLLSVFEKSFNELYNLCLNKILNEESSNKNDKGVTNRAFSSLKTIFVTKPKYGTDFEDFTKKNLDEIVNIMKIFLSDFEKNINKIPVYVYYCLTRVKKKLKKLVTDNSEQSKDKNYLSMREKIKSAIKRLFYKQLLPKLLDKAKNDYIIQLKKKRQKVSDLFSSFINLISLLFEKASVNNLFKPSDDIDDDNVVENFSFLNENIKAFSLTLKEIFDTILITSKYDSKTQSISATFYANMTPTVKKIKTNLKDITELLKIVNIAKDKLKSNPHTIDFSNYSIFNLLFDKLGTLKSDILLDNTLTVNLYIDSRYMIEPSRFHNRYMKELRLGKKWEGENSNLTLDFLNRCCSCHLIVPNYCILDSDCRDVQLYKPFKAKVKKEYFMNVCQVLKDYDFLKQLEINSIEDLANAIDSYIEMSPLMTDSATRLLGGIQEFNKNDGKDKLYDKFLTQLKNHIKVQHKHFDFVLKISKNINDINEAENIYFNKIESINKDLDSAINSIKLMDNSLVYEDKSNDVMAAMSRLTHSRIKLQKYSGDSENFKYNILDQPVRNLLRKNVILFLHNDKENEGEKSLNRIEITSNTDGAKYFQISLKGKSKETLASYKFSYDQFVYHCVNSNCFSAIFMENFSNFSTIMFQKSMHDLIYIDNKQKKTKAKE